MYSPNPALSCAPDCRALARPRQLVEALQRAGAAPSARAAVRQLMEGGVRPPVELMAFLNIDAPRRPGSTLYKAMFGASKKHEARLGEATPIQRWCDERGPRPRGPRGAWGPQSPEGPLLRCETARSAFYAC